MIVRAVGHVQEQLKLTQQQQEEILHARSRLLRRLQQCSEDRLAAYAAVGLDLTALPKVSGLSRSTAAPEG